MSRRILASAALTLLVSCGGGGGGGSTNVSVSFNPPSITATAFQQQAGAVNAVQDASVDVVMSISGTVSGPAFALVQDTGSAFSGSPISVIQETSSSYRATLKPNAALPPGQYSGTLVLRLCKDAACSQEYSVGDGTLAYRVTMLPQMQVTVLVNGAAAGTMLSGGTPMFLSVADGSTLEIRSNVPIETMASDPGGIVTVNPASTGAAWKAVLARPASPTSNRVSLYVLSKDATAGTQLAANVNVTMVP